MKRVSIFSFYDSDGIVDDYIIHLLKELNNISNELYFVVNGLLTSDGKRKIEKLTKNIIIRDNIGFDAGTYKDVLINHIGKEKVKIYDEVVLCNNTFFGPFIPMKSIFLFMEQKNVDFWGLNYLPRYICPHLQSYFLVFRKNILTDGTLIEFFDKFMNAKEKDITNTLVYFELGIFKFLTDRNYIFSEFSVPNNCDIYKSGNYAIKKYGLPILKKKINFSKEVYLDNYLDAVKYISLNTNYDVSLIINYIKRKYDICLDIARDNLKCIEFRLPYKNKSLEEIKETIQSYNKIYLYGAGQLAKKLFKIFSLYQVDIDGFAISDNQEIFSDFIYGKPVYHISDVPNIDDVLFMIAMNVENINDCNRQIEKLCHVLWVVR